MYDYVIIGAGSAGCVLANRLTENPNIHVLLLEAGKPDQKSEIQIPIAFSKLFKSEYDWAYYTEKQPHLNHRQIFFPRGKCLGGSSSINAMIYIRGDWQDYNNWEKAGNSGWGAEDILAYFIKSENQTRENNQYHGVGGNLNVTDLRYINPLTQSFIAAALATGLPLNNDFNAVTREGVGYLQVTQKNGQRHSAATAYLKPILNRPNLTIKTNALVIKIHFENKQATGLTYLQDNIETEIKIRREIILSGGAINSPQLLMLSGIGDATHLKSLNIPVIHNLPGVGQNLQDHIGTPNIYNTTKPISLLIAKKLKSILQYLIFKNGPLTSNVAEAAAFVKSNSDLNICDLQIHFSPIMYLNEGLTEPTEHGFTLGPVLLYPQSKGYVNLRSPHPSTPPIIQPNYLADINDAQALVTGLKICRQIIQKPAFDGLRGAELYPGLSIQTDSELIEFVRNYSQTLYHPVGTCKMGNDTMSVVNSQLQVQGIQGLRVVDASIMPTIIGGNTNAATIMIAEKAADMISK